MYNVSCNSRVNNRLILYVHYGGTHETLARREEDRLS
jgi:hypothetical protein